jgi:hypothetical protein
MEQQEEIRLRCVPVALAETVSLDGADGRLVDVVEPVARDLGFSEDAAALTHEVVAVDLKVLEQLEVDRRPAGREPHTASRFRKPALLEEHPLELAENDLEHDGYRTAARLTASRPEQRYLVARAAALGRGD